MTLDVMVNLCELVKKQKKILKLWKFGPASKFGAANRAPFKQKYMALLNEWLALCSDEDR
jgi:hypothetical protein